MQFSSSRNSTSSRPIIRIVYCNILEIKCMPSCSMTTKLELKRSERMQTIRIVNVQGQQGQQ
ncbi:hypothetical protein T4B_9593 [Trichinella pseudospiralis]|uniref:Uncharacterized protein n=1 Tax=Trichinella pseudospiralis TaxID=6337 RepID=A0A0V1I9R0_TRIPS|nr:hypothetical protein T4B_9593 [Trichinella pseudospiralis]